MVFPHVWRFGCPGRYEVSLAVRDRLGVESEPARTQVDVLSATGVAVVGSLWGWARPSWYGGSVNVNVNRYNNINVNRPPINSPVWRPPPPGGPGGRPIRPPGGPVGPAVRVRPVIGGRI